MTHTDAVKKHGWQIGISVLAGLFLLLHLVWPSLKPDSITVVLLAIVLAPWLGKIIKSLELPGGVKFEFRDFERAAEQAEKAGLLEPEPAKENDPTYIAILDEDPNLALSGLRIELERRLRNIAERFHISSHQTSRATVLSLQAMNELNEEQGAALRDILRSLNKAAHGSDISRQDARQVMQIGQRLIKFLDQNFGAVEPV